MPVLDSFELGRKAAGGGRFSGVSEGVGLGFQALLQKMQQNQKMKELAQAAIFEDNPASAYGVLGMEAPEGGGAPEAPEGMQPHSQTTKRGNTSTTFQAPDELNMVKLFEIYTKRASEYDENAFFRASAARASKVKDFKDKPYPSFDEWLEKSNILKTMEKKVSKKPAEEEAPTPTTTPKVDTGAPKDTEIVQMKAPDGRTVPVHKSRVKEAKERGLKPISE